MRAGRLAAPALAWKEALIAQVDRALAAPPSPAPGPAEWPELDLAAREYQPVTVTGTFFERNEVYVSYTLTRKAARTAASAIW